MGNGHAVALSKEDRPLFHRHRELVSASSTVERVVDIFGRVPFERTSSSTITFARPAAFPHAIIHDKPKHHNGFVPTHSDNSVHVTFRNVGVGVNLVGSGNGCCSSSGSNSTGWTVTSELPPMPRQALNYDCTVLDDLNTAASYQMIMTWGSELCALFHRPSLLHLSLRVRLLSGRYHTINCPQDMLHPAAVSSFELIENSEGCPKCRQRTHRCQPPETDLLSDFCSVAWCDVVFESVHEHGGDEKEVVGDGEHRVIVRGVWALRAVRLINESTVMSGCIGITSDPSTGVTWMIVEE
eukprot:PhM_4_TR7558/c0_g1_i2/m.3774